MDASAILRGWRAVLALPGEYLQELANKVTYLPDRNYKQASRYASEGKFRDAVFRLKVVLWLAPQHQPSWYLMGACLYSMGDFAGAMSAFNTAYRLKPDHADTLFMMAAIDPKRVPRDKIPVTMPRRMAEDYFDKIAGVYDSEQRNAGYRGHIFLDEGVRRNAETHRSNYEVLDLGCGTGLTGEEVQDIARHVVGVDFSRNMLDHARARIRPDGRVIYDETVHRDLRDYLSASAAPRFDLILAAHVFNYVGDLAGVFQGCSRAILLGGIWVFQVEPHSGSVFGLIPEMGRFGHSQEYILGQASANGFRVIEQRRVDVYPKYPLDQYVLKKE